MKYYDNKIDSDIAICVIQATKNYISVDSYIKNREVFGHSNIVNQFVLLYDIIERNNEASW